MPRPKTFLTTNCTASALSKEEKRQSDLKAASSVSGRVEKILRQDGKLLLITFSNCTVKHGDRVLFDPAWGEFDMAVGEKISSVFNGAADKDAYLEVALVPKERTIKVPSDAKRKKLENLYQQVRDIRERKSRLRAARRNLGNAAGASIPTTGYSRWKFSKFSTRPGSNRS